MENTVTLPGNTMAERVVRHFQAEGFVGIQEALIIRIRLRHGERAEIVAAFNAASEQQTTPPLNDYFEIQPYGYFSHVRSFAETKAAIQSDFTLPLRQAVPKIYFDVAPVVVDDALATGTKYDALIKLSDNVGEYAFAILLNDPDSSFFEYLGTHHGDNWQEILGDFASAAATFGSNANLI